MGRVVPKNGAFGITIVEIWRISLDPLPCVWRAGKRASQVTETSQSCDTALQHLHFWDHLLNESTVYSGVVCRLRF